MIYPKSKVTVIADLRAENAALRAAIDAERKAVGLGDLLAVIHCDGGHYQAEHGTAMAIEDAIAVVHSIRAQNSAVDELAMLVRRLAHMLQNSSPEMDLPKKAMDYLKIAGLAGLPMRLVGDA